MTGRSAVGSEWLTSCCRLAMVTQSVECDPEKVEVVRSNRAHGTILSSMVSRAHRRRRLPRVQFPKHLGGSCNCCKLCFPASFKRRRPVSSEAEHLAYIQRVGISKFSLGTISTRRLSMGELKWP